MNQKRRPNRSPLTVLSLPALDRILQTDRSRRTWGQLFLIIDQPLHHGPVPARLLEQIVKQSRLPQRPREQFLSDMWFPAQPPPHGLNPERDLAFRSKRWMCLFLRIDRVNQIHAAIGTLQQAMINIRAAIAAFDFIIFGWGSDTGGHRYTFLVKIHRSSPGL